MARVAIIISDYVTMVLCTPIVVLEESFEVEYDQYDLEPPSSEEYYDQQSTDFYLKKMTHHRC